MSLRVYYKRACITRMGANQHTTKGQPKRTRTVLVRLTEDEFVLLAEGARGNKCSVSEYLRYCLRLQIKGDAQERTRSRSSRGNRHKNVRAS